MSPREDDHLKFQPLSGPVWGHTYGPGTEAAFRIAARLDRLEAEEGKERRDALVQWAIESPWPVERWLDAYDRIWHRQSRWQMLEEAMKLGLGPNLALVLSDLLDIEEESRPRIGPARWRGVLPWAIIVLAAVIFAGFVWALIEAIVT